MRPSKGEGGKMSMLTMVHVTLKGDEEGGGSEHALQGGETSPEGPATPRPEGRVGELSLRFRKKTGKTRTITSKETLLKMILGEGGGAERATVLNKTCSLEE